MPKMNCLGNCGKQVRNPPSRGAVTGFCAVCLGLAHKTKKYTCKYCEVPLEKMLHLNTQCWSCVCGKKVKA